MVDDVLINKAATIERCVQRAREEYFSEPATFATNFTRQDAAILNIQRACEASLDMGLHIIRREHLGIAQNILDHHLDDFLDYSQQMLLRDKA